jgi:hypothetical protein
MVRPLQLPIRAIFLALLIGASPLLGQSGQPATHPVSGRQIAGVMGWQGAAWLDRTEREVEEEPDKALDAIGILVSRKRARQQALAQAPDLVLVKLAHEPAYEVW